MSEMSTLQGSQPAAPPQPLACRLRRKEEIGRRGPLENMAEVELENISAGPLEIAYRMTALQYLNQSVAISACASDNEIDPAHTIRCR